MKTLTIIALYTFLLCQSLFSQVNAQALSRNLGTIQARGVGNGNGTRGDNPTGPAVPAVAVDDDDDVFDDDADDDDADDDDADDDDDMYDDDDDMYDDDDDDTAATPGFLDPDGSVNADDDETTTKPGLANDDDATPASAPVPAFFQGPPSTAAPTLTAQPSPALSDAPSSTPTQTAAPTVTSSDAPSSTPTKTPMPTITASDAPSSTPTKTPLPTIAASDAPSSTPTKTPFPTAEASDSPSSTPTQTPSPTLGASNSPSSKPKDLQSAISTDVPTSAPTGTPTSAASDLSTAKDNQSILPDQVTRFLRPFAVRLSVKDSNSASDEEIRSGLKLLLEQLLETKLGLVFSDLTGIFLEHLAPQARSDGSELYSFTGKGFFDSTPVTAPSHAALQAAQMKVLSEFLFELEEMLKDNGIDVDTVVAQISSDVKQDQGTSEKSGGAGQQDVPFTFDDNEDGDGDDPETVVLGVQDEPSGSSSVYIVIASTLTVSLGVIVLGLKRGFGSQEPEAVATRQPRENVMVVDADAATDGEQSPV